MLRVLAKVVKGLHLGTLMAQKSILVILFIPLTLAMFAETFARYVIGQGFFAMEDFIGYTAVWLYFIGAAYATYERTQVKAEIMNIFIKNHRALSIIKAVVSGISVAVSIIFVQWAYALAAFSIEADYRTPVFQVPFIYFQVSILVGAVLMLIYFIWESVDQILAAVHATTHAEGKEA
ncbi:TRAP transporter small permease [Chloroflexota bacterium]